MQVIEKLQQQFTKLFQFRTFRWVKTSWSSQNYALLSRTRYKSVSLSKQTSQVGKASKLRHFYFEKRQFSCEKHITPFREVIRQFFRVCNEFFSCAGFEPRIQKSARRTSRGIPSEIALRWEFIWMDSKWNFQRPQQLFWLIVLLFRLASSDHQTLSTKAAILR